MYLGIDVGGTKTLVATLTDNGQIKQQSRFPTPKEYNNFLSEITNTVDKFATKDFEAGGIGLPAILDRDRSVALKFANLPWRDVHVKADLERLLSCPIAVNNDAKLAGLSEAMVLKDSYQKVLYVTISTGIGTGLTIDQQINEAISDAGGRIIKVEHNGKLVDWESFASGSAIVRRYGKMAENIHDEETWRKISRDLSIGLLELISITEPEAIVFGGSVGAFFERFEKPLTTELKKYQTPLLAIPKLLGAQRPNEAVIYGCYDLAKQVYG